MATTLASLKIKLFTDGAEKAQIVEMAMNASGIRDTARVLHVSPTTVLKELTNRHLTCSM